MDQTLKERPAPQDSFIWISVRVPRLLGEEYKELLRREETTASQDLRRHMRERALNGVRT